MFTATLALDRPALPHAYLANGLLGLRVPPVPLPGGTALVGGLVGLSPEKGTEEYAPAPYPVGCDLQLERVWLSAQPATARCLEQRLDLACGELHSRFTMTVGETVAEVAVLTLCSRTQPTVALQEVTVTVNRACALVLQPQLDPRGLLGQLGYRCMPAKHQDGILRWDTRGGLGSVGAAYLSEFQGEGLRQRRRNDYGHEQDLLLTQYAIDAQPGRRYRLRQYGALVPSLLHGEPHWQAARTVRFATWHGFDEVRAVNRAAWAELWRGRVQVTGDPRWQQHLDAAFCYLHSSVSPASPCSVAPFGLSRRCEYSGHVFWDTETFMYPATLLTAPATARAILDYRSRCLPAARANALLNGYRGLQFPWQSGNGGWEVSPFYSGAAGGLAEQHVTLDVAYAFAQYVHATGDELFLRQQAWPVLEQVAEWLLSRVERTSRGYEIRHHTGPDEGLDNVNNNTMTNGMAMIVLRQAAALARRLGLTPPAVWAEVADAMFLPIDPMTQALLKHDGYRNRDGVCQPETMMLYFPFGWRHSPAVDAATQRFHLDLAHTYLGQPMNSANYAVWASRAGDRVLARECLERGTASRIVTGAYHQFVESALPGGYGDDVTPCFVTACGALLTACLLGLTGLDLDDGEPAAWARHPICLPEGWEVLEVERLWARGRPWQLTARHGAERAVLTPIAVDA